MNESVEPMLGELHDRQSIADVLATFCERIDEYDVDGLVDVFTPDCFVDYGPGRGGPVTGRDAVLARIATGQSEFRRTQHQLGQSLVRLSGDQADATTYVTAMHEAWDGDHSRVHLRYLDHLERSAHGWRIARRDVQACVVVGFADVPWNYVERRRPGGSAMDA